MQNTSYRTIQLKKYSNQGNDSFTNYNLSILIENIYRTLHYEKFRIILFHNKLDYSLAKQIALTHGYNKNILIFQKNYNLIIYIKVVYAIYEYARNN